MNGSQNTSSSQRVAVIGAGVGGLVAALELAQKGLRVTLLERADSPGGKMRRRQVQGRALDVGPTVLTMRWVFEEIFRDAGEDLREHITLTPLEILGRHGWQDQSRLDLYADLERSAAAIADFASPKEVDGFRRFHRYAESIYRYSELPFIRSQKPTLGGLLGLLGVQGMARLHKIDSMRTMHKALRGFFKDPRLLQLFARYATYYGSSPYLCPATLNLIAFVEQQGVWVAEGGMHALALTLAKLCEKRGVDIRAGSHVEEITTEGERISGVRLQGGAFIPAEVVVHNGDINALSSGLLGEEAARGLGNHHHLPRSLSALTLAAVGRPRGFPLQFHNVFFSGDYPAEFDDIVNKERLPQSPTVYICAQDRAPGMAAPEGAERLFFIINAPAIGDAHEFSDAEKERCIDGALAVLRGCGLEIAFEAVEATSPTEFARAFPATGGAIYGPATHTWNAPLSRAGSRGKLRGLYIAGGSAHPGAGVPMAALGGRMAAESVIHDLGLGELPKLVGTV